MAVELVSNIDDSVIAHQVVSEKRRLGKTAPGAADLTKAIVDIQPTDTIQGASTLVVTIADPDWELLDSGFFDVDKDGRPDPIDLHYPTDSDLWWRLTQIELRGADEQVDLTFMERVAVYLMSHHGPLKTSRAKHTRAEFLKSLTDRVKAGGGITFISKELHKKQPIAGPDQPKDKRQRKDKGLTKFSATDLKVKGSKLTGEQIRNADALLGVAEDEDAGPKATKAMMVAAIGESTLIAQMNAGGSPYGGVLQGNVRDGTFALDDTEGMARCFLLGGKGFNYGGAIKLAHDHPDWTPGKIATAVEGSGEAPSFYDVYGQDADAIIEAFGGASAGTPVESYRKQYNFTVGDADNPHETFWDASNRLADEVAWAYFVDGPRVYYDSELTLIKQAPVARIQRGSPQVIDFDVTWDARHIATEMTVELVIDPFELRAGEVVVVAGFGPASAGSTAKPKLPGRWLIETIEGSRFRQPMTFTLKQPTKPKREPAPELAQRSGDTGTDVNVTSDMAPKDVIDQIVIPIAKQHDMTTGITPKMVEEANARHGPTVDGNISDHQGPPDKRWAGDMSNGSSPTPQMDALARDLAERFGIPWHGSGLVSKTDSLRGFRYQLIYRTMEGGNHFNHVHFGCATTR